MSTAKLAMWLHWQLTWLSLGGRRTLQPRADQLPVPLTLCEGGRVRRQEGVVHWGLGHRVQAHRIEWFQKTDGSVRSSVSSSRNCT